MGGKELVCLALLWLCRPVNPIFFIYNIKLEQTKWAFLSRSCCWQILRFRIWHKQILDFFFPTGFEAGGNHTPSSISPWSIIGDNSSILVATDRTSCFSRNIVAVRMEALCNDCPAGGVGIYNPGFWGMVCLCHVLIIAQISVMNV